MLIVNPEERCSLFAESAPDGPIVMVNLFKVKDGIDPIQFVMKLKQGGGPTMARIGAEPIYAGVAGPEFCAEDDWDLVALVKYPSYQALLSLGADKE